MFGFCSQRVYLHLFGALACGCAAGFTFPLPVELLTGDALLIACILLLLVAIWFNVGRLQTIWAVTPGFALLACIGFLITSVAIGLPLTATLNNHAGTESLVIEGQVVSMPKYQRGHLRFMLEAVEVDTADGTTHAVNGCCYVYLKADPPPELYFTERVRLHTNLKEIEPPRNRGQFDYRQYLLMRGTVLTAYSASPRQLTRLSKEPPFLWAGLAHLRSWLTGSLQRGLPEDLGELTVSVVYGDKITDLSDTTSERFRRAGLTHILVASGTQISLLIVLLAMLCWRINDDFSWRGLLLNVAHFAVTLTVVSAYAAITGFETSIVRALAMGALVMAGRLLHRQADGLTALAQSGLILLLLNPLALMSPGFQLSFGATFGLIYTAGVAFPLMAHLTGWRRWVAQTLITTGGAQLFVAPILAAHFQQLSLWGLISNMIAIPLAFCLLITGGLLSVGLSYIPVLGEVLRWLAWLNAWLLDRTAWLFAALPGSNIAVPHPPLWWLLVFYAAVFLTGEWVKCRAEIPPATTRRLKLAVPAVVMLLYGGVLWWLAVPCPELTTLDLARCEAYIWRPYSGGCLLLTRQRGIDRSHNADTVASALRFRGINRLDGIVLIDAKAGDKPPDRIARFIPDYPAQVIVPGEPIPGHHDIDWLCSGADVAGVRMAFGKRKLWVVWDESLEPVAVSANPAASADAGAATAVDIVVMRTTTAERMGYRRRGELMNICDSVVAVGNRTGDLAGLGVVTGEYSIRP